MKELPFIKKNKLLIFMTTSPYISIIIPVYNEKLRILDTLKKTTTYLSENYADSEIIVVDDGSADETGDLVKKYFNNFPSVKNLFISLGQNYGKGRAVKTGLLAAKGQIAVFFDADLSTPLSEIPKIIKPIEEGYDLAFGSRALAKSQIQIHQSWIRRNGGRVFNFLVRTLTGLPFYDTQCGFKAFKMEKTRTVIESSTTDRFGFDVELIAVAYQTGLKLIEIPVLWNHMDDSKVSVIKDGWRVLKELIKIRKKIKGL